MTWYVIKLLVMLPLLALLIWGSLKLTTRLQARMSRGPREKSARLLETTILSPGIRLAVVEFHGREILIGSTRHGLTRLAEAVPTERAAVPASTQTSEL